MAGSGELEVPDLGVLLGRLRTLGQLPFVALSLSNGWYELIADRTTLAEMDPLETADERLLAALDGTAEHDVKKAGAAKETGGSQLPSLAHVLLRQESARRPVSLPFIREPIEATPASERHVEGRFAEQQEAETASNHPRGFVATRPGPAAAARAEVEAAAALAAVLARHAPSADRPVRQGLRAAPEPQGFPEQTRRGPFDGVGTQPRDPSSPRATRGAVSRQAQEQRMALPRAGQSPKRAAERGKATPSTPPSLSRSNLTNQAVQTVVSRERPSALFESLGRIAFASRAVGEQRDEPTSASRTTRSNGSSSPLEASVHPFASHSDNASASGQGPGAVPSTSDGGRSLPTATELSPRAVSHPTQPPERRSVSRSRLSQSGRIGKSNEPWAARSGSGLRQLVIEWEQQHPPAEAAVDSSETSPIEEPSFDEADFPGGLRSVRSCSPQREEDDGLLEEERVAQALERVLQREARRHGLRWEEG